MLATDEFNPTAELYYAVVTVVSSREAGELRQVTYRDEAVNFETLKATPEHEFFVVGVGWLNASQLNSSHVLLLPDGSTADVTSVTTVAGETVHNLTVTDGATYFVDGPEPGVDAVVSRQILAPTRFF